MVAEDYYFGEYGLKTQLHPANSYCWPRRHLGQRVNRGEPDVVIGTRWER